VFSLPDLTKLLLFHPKALFQVWPDLTAGAKLKTESNMSQHTPGPWSVIGSGAGQTQVCGRRNGQICEIASYLYDETNEPELDELEANARLIAAAPELLEALKELQSQIQQHFKLDVKKHFSLMLANVAASKAIDKAEKS